MFKLKARNYVYIILTLIFIGLFINAAFYDYKIGEKIGNIWVNHWFSVEFSNLGNMIIFFPSYTIVIVYVLKILSITKFETKTKILLITLVNICAAITIGLIIFLMKSENTTAHKIWCGLTFGIILSSIILINYLWLKILIVRDNESINKLFNMANKSLIFIATTSLTVSIMKVIFGRNRPGSVYNGGMDFQYPFEINFKRDGKNSTSFPSGHTMAVGELIFILYFLKFKSKKTEIWLKSIVGTIVISLTIATAISRMTMQKHFLTDVMFSMFLLTVYFLAAPSILKKIYKWGNYKNG